MHTSRRTDPQAAKRRDRARSLLPSSARSSARRDLQAVRRRHRRAVRQSLAGLHQEAVCVCGDEEDYLTAGVDNSPCSLCGYVEPDYPLSDHLWAVWDRRSADKLGPVLRWARLECDAECAELGVDVLGYAEAADLLRRLRSELPDGVIGWHAMSHLRFEIEPRRIWGSRRSGHASEQRVEHLAHIARWALENGLHGKLNRQTHVHTAHRAFDEELCVELGQDYRPCPEGWVQTRWSRWRPLVDVHDVDDWARAVYRPSDHQPGPHPLVVWAEQMGWKAPLVDAVE